MNVSTPPCIVCGRGSVLEVDEEGYARWRGGELVQLAFPDLDAAQRELLMTGTHDHCWTRMHSTRCSSCGDLIPHDEVLLTVDDGGHQVFDVRDGFPTCEACAGLEGMRDPSFYVDGTGHAYVCSVRYGSEGPIANVYANGIMRLVDLGSDTVMRTALDLPSAGIYCDADMKKAEEAGRLEWLNNAWFDLYDSNGNSCEAIEHDLVEAIHLAHALLAEGGIS